MKMIMQESSRRVVVTGLGVVSSLGTELTDFWSACRDGRTGVRMTTDSDARPVAAIASVDSFSGVIGDFGRLDAGKSRAIRKGVKLMSREIQFGVATAQKALDDAKVEALPSERVGVSYASDYVVSPPFELTDAIKACAKIGEDGKPRLDFDLWSQFGLPKMVPTWQLKYLTNMSASHITIYNEFFGPAFDVTNREASFPTALAEAVHTIQSGRADYMIVGATGSKLHPYRFLDALVNDEISKDLVRQAPSDSAIAATRPFDARRRGYVPGEGAGAVFIETAESAIKRGAKIYAEIVGGVSRAVVKAARDLGGSGCDLIPSRDALKDSFALTLRSLVERFSIDVATLGHINANAVGDLALDSAEALALREIFGERLDQIPVTSLAGALGGAGAGAGAIETIASVLALQNGELFPTLNFAQADPECPVTPLTALGKSGNSFVKLSGNRVGQTSAIYVKRFDG